MKTFKICCVILSLFASLAGSSTILTASKQSTPLMRADGGAPVPPVPHYGMLVADGGAPVPPWPHYATLGA